MTYKNNTGLKVESELEVEIPEEQLSSLLFYPMVDGYGWYIIAVYTSQPVQPQLTISPSAAPSLNPNTIPALASTMTFANQFS